MTADWSINCPYPRDVCPIHGGDAMYDDRTAAGIAAGVERRDVCAECEAGAARGRSQLAPSPRRFDVLGGPGGYLSARHVGAMRPGEYVDGWDRLVRVNVPRRIRPSISPRTVYLDVLRHYRARGCAV